MFSESKISKFTVTYSLTRKWEATATPLISSASDIIHTSMTSIIKNIPVILKFKNILMNCHQYLSTPLHLNWHYCRAIICRSQMKTYFCWIYFPTIPTSILHFCGFEDINQCIWQYMVWQFEFCHFLLCIFILSWGIIIFSRSFHIVIFGGVCFYFVPPLFPTNTFDGLIGQSLPDPETFLLDAEYSRLSWHCPTICTV